MGTRNVRSRNQGKLEVVKREMARVNIDILGISELKWTEMGKFNSDDHYFYYYYYNILSPCLFHVYAEHIMQNARLDKA